MANLDGIGTSQQQPPTMFGCQLFREGAFCSVKFFATCNSPRGAGMEFEQALA
jgi:hypothetical protein